MEYSSHLRTHLYSFINIGYQNSFQLVTFILTGKVRYNAELQNAKTTCLPKEKGKKGKMKKKKDALQKTVNLSHKKTKYNLTGPDICAKISADPPNLLQVKREFLQKIK